MTSNLQVTTDRFARVEFWWSYFYGVTGLTGFNVHWQQVNLLIESPECPFIKMDGFTSKIEKDGTIKYIGIYKLKYTIYNKQKCCL